MRRRLLLFGFAALVAAVLGVGLAASRGQDEPGQSQGGALALAVADIFRA